jgi:hypothetical protein
MKKISEHYASIGETYFRHMAEALWISVKLLIAATACFVHSLFPFMFQNTASTIIQNILNNVGERKDVRKN